MNWWFADGDQRRGPYSESEFSILVENGTVRPATLVWREGMPEWTRYESVSGPGTRLTDTGDSLRFAGFWIRYAGKYIDSLILTPAVVLLSLVYWVISSRPFDDEDQIPAAFLTITLTSIILSALYNTVFVGAYGATPGKMFLKLRIVRADGSPIGYGLALLRWFAALLNYFTLGIGWIMAGLTQEKTALHDKICGTRVLDHGSRVGGPAGFWIRYMARTIDNFFLSVPSMFLGFILGIVLVATQNQNQELLLAGRLLGNLFGIFLSFVYFTYFIGAYGATPGKMLLGLKVIGQDGSSVSYARSAGRWFSTLVNYLTLGIGWLIAAFDKDKRGLHDIICSTRVIHTR